MAEAFGGSTLGLFRCDQNSSLAPFCAMLQIRRQTAEIRIPGIASVAGPLQREKPMGYTLTELVGQTSEKHGLQF